MTNIFKSLQEKINEKTIKIETRHISSDKKKTNASKRKKRIIINMFFSGAVVLATVFLVYAYLDKKTYHEYKVVLTSNQEDVISTKYNVLDGKVFRYNTDGVTLMSNKLEKIWYEPYTMKNPIADIRKDKAVIVDKDGTTLEIYNKNGKTGSVTTPYSIVKASISSSGIVAAILDSGEDAWINFFAPNGNLIAETQTKIDDPGYPIDVAVSNDGTIMMVTYQYVDGSNVTSYVAFYNFGTVGQDKEDRIVSGYTYEGTVVPQVEYLGNSWSVALKDNGLSFYRGKQIPKEMVVVEKDKEIISTFCDLDHAGFIYKNEDVTEDKAYTMEVYSSTGKQEFSESFNIPYTNVKFSDDSILMYNSSQMCIINEDGHIRYRGEVDANLRDLVKIGWNRYLLILDGEIDVIKFN